MENHWSLKNDEKDCHPQLYRSSLFWCYYNETLRSSIYEGEKVKMNHEKIRISRGGEKSDDMTGRRDEEELLVFKIVGFRYGVMQTAKLGFEAKKVLKEGKKLTK